MLVLTVAVVASPACGRPTLSTPDASGSAGGGGSGNDGGAAGTSSGGVGGTGGAGAVGVEGTGGVGGTTTGGTGGAGAVGVEGTGGAGGTTTGGTAGSCSADRLTAVEATTLYTTYAFEVQPGLNPATRFEASELDVAGLWEDLHAQLFYVRGTFETGAYFRNCTILTHDCQIFVPAGTCIVFGTLASGLVANGAFYFSWGAGSGSIRSQVGKLTPSGMQFTRSESTAYYNANNGPPPLVVQRSASDILVYRADTTVFNQWSSPPEYIGKLQDLGDRLTIVDGSGQPIANTLP